MASYEKNKKSNIWSVRFRIVEGGLLVNKRLSGFDLKKDAEAAYREFIATYVPEIRSNLPSNITFDELYHIYKKYAECRIKDSTKVSIESAMKQHILPYFRDKKILAIKKTRYIKMAGNS